MAELRENARYIFCSGALSFHVPKIIFLRDKHEEFPVDKSSFILCSFVYPRCYGRLKYCEIQRTNGIENIVYFTRVVTNDRKFSWRWNIVAKLLQEMKNNVWKKWVQDSFRCLVRALWKCTESTIEIMQIRYVLADFELEYFFAKIKTRRNFWILFLKTVHQEGLLEQKL